MAKGGTARIWIFSRGSKRHGSDAGHAPCASAWIRGSRRAKVRTTCSRRSMAIVEATAPYAACFKPNAAFYEAFGAAGYDALVRLVAMHSGETPVLLDAKRCDIGPTAEAYAKACFEAIGADAVTLSPYMGRDSVDPFLAYPDKAVFMLARTSNPRASVFQDFAAGGHPVRSWSPPNARRGLTGWGSSRPATIVGLGRGASCRAGGLAACAGHRRAGRRHRRGLAGRCQGRRHGRAAGGGALGCRGSRSARRRRRPRRGDAPGMDAGAGTKPRSATAPASDPAPRSSVASCAASSIPAASRPGRSL